MIDAAKLRAIRDQADAIGKSAAGAAVVPARRLRLLCDDFARCKTESGRRAWLEAQGREAMRLCRLLDPPADALLEGEALAVAAGMVFATNRRTRVA
ncbi:MAG: hypothetical protein IH945_02190 [Armatimonadetes bacterium]|nr:hypothetical protein [Armatimonadota bacterium]